MPLLEALPTGIIWVMIFATIIGLLGLRVGWVAYTEPTPRFVLHYTGWTCPPLAMLYGGIAMLLFGFSESIAGWFSGTPVGDQFAALLGTFSLRPSGYIVLAVQAVLIGAVTAVASRQTLFATLNDVD